MTPKEKAKELANSFWDKITIDIDKGAERQSIAKQSALICCDNCIEINEWYADNFPILKRNSLERNEYWNEVKQEISYL